MPVYFEDVVVPETKEALGRPFEVAEESSSRNQYRVGTRFLSTGLIYEVITLVFVGN